MESFRLLPWYSKYLPRQLEQVAPNNKATIGSLAAGGRLFSSRELSTLYASAPWSRLHRPPEPIAFDPADRRFKALYLSTLSLYRQHARALWDRTHFFLPADGPGRSELLAQRRRRNSSMSAAFKQHYRYLMDFVRTNSFVDADIFMDPFFFWPPPVGVLLAFGRDGESVGDCVDRLDRAEPFRIYYAHSRSRSRHPVSVCYERVFGKFVQTRPPSAVGPPSDDSGLRAPSAPPASPPGSPTTAALDALRDRREGPESPRANPHADCDVRCPDARPLGA
ncbi:hypothetical protein P43SY_010863 [Pythium insidiosum]|uniref:Uncharacterized protein n=1 Tax=Pythium insidiosum TaxID=114742 RepID=A0AAD5LTN4_PYTIN|nr:hypothetical protein P43SY_010863 [Pythium insidiosum]